MDFDVPSSSSEFGSEARHIAELLAADPQANIPQTGFSRFKAFVVRQLENIGLVTRSIGISVTSTTKQVLDIILGILKPVFSGTLTWIFDLLQRILNSIIDKLWNAAQQNLDAYRTFICSTAVCVLASLAVCLPKMVVSKFGRFLLIGVSVLIYYTRSYLAVGIATGLVYVLTKFAPNIGVGIDINNYIATPQGFQEDVTSLVMNLVSLGVLLSAATTGLSFPTDAKSWDEMLKRHSLLHRSFTAWEFGIGKLTEIFETVARFIYKYFFGKEFISFEYISEVEKLYTEVIELTRLDINVDIGRDVALSNRIEAMYASYLNLLRVYSRNTEVIRRLQRIGGPLTEFYRRVADKNPKAHVMRKEPVCIALYGPTGIGKSYLMSRMQQDLLKISGKFDPNNPTDGLVYSRSIEQEFWDGYTGQPIAIYDDFAQKVDSPTNPNNEFFEIIRAVNIFPYQLHSAAIQEKANNPFTSDFVILTTNLENFKPKSIISEDAFTRRIHVNCKISLIPSVQDLNTRTPMLNVHRLRRYQEENNLPFYDLSHLQFEIKDQILTYDEFIVKISLEYKNKLEAFELRQKGNEVMAPQPLPAGAFSVNSTWAQPQGLIRDMLDGYYRRISIIPTYFGMKVYEFNSWFRLNVWNKFVGADSRVTRFLCNIWSDMEWFRAYVNYEFTPYIRAFTMMTVTTAVAATMVPVFSHLFSEEAFDQSPLLTTLVRGFVSVRAMALTSSLGPLYFYPTVAGSIIGLSRTVIRDILKHSIIHQVFDSSCERCKKNKTYIKDLQPSTVVVDPADLLCELEHVKVDSDEVTVESVTKTQIKEKSNIESVTKTQVQEKSKLESATKVPVRERVVYESTSEINFNEQKGKLNRVFPESGRCDDSKKKNAACFEGIRCHQLENLKNLAQRNVWLLSTYAYGEKNDVGFVTVLKGHKAVCNFHYFQIMAKRFKDVPHEERRIFFSQPSMSGGHEMQLCNFVRTAIPILRGTLQTEFYLVSLPKTCNLGRDLTKHLIHPSKVTNLQRGVSLQLTTFRADSAGHYRPATIAGDLEKIATSYVQDLQDPNLCHEYLESIYYKAPTRGGDCGNPVFVDDDAFEKKLVGFHFAGLAGKGICCVLTADDVNKHLDDEMCLADPTDINVSMDEDQEFPIPDSSFSHRV